jgi:hypothetical protein
MVKKLQRIFLKTIFWPKAHDEVTLDCLGPKTGWVNDKFRGLLQNDLKPLKGQDTMVSGLGHGGTTLRIE